MLTSLHSHSAFGAVSTAIVIFIWNRYNQDKRLSILVFGLLGGFVARIPDWDLFLNKELHWDSTNMAHRSVYTHSIFGVFLFWIAFLFLIYTYNLLIRKYSDREKIPWKISSVALSASILSHLVTDAMEDYPTRTFYPFSNQTEFYGFIPMEVYHSQYFIVSSWIIGFGGVVILHLIEKYRLGKVTNSS